MSQENIQRRGQKHTKKAKRAWSQKESVWEKGEGGERERERRVERENRGKKQDS